jgi:hypothetical protein
MTTTTERLKEMIVRPVSSDGMVGYDRFGQFVVAELDRDAIIYRHLFDVRLLTCPICGRGWELNAESIRDQYRDYYTEKRVHKRCHEGRLALDEFRMFYRALCDAKFHHWKSEEIPNQYGGAWNTPWYRFRLDQFPGTTLTMGPRRRVYHIGVSGNSNGLLDDFASEEVTKGYDELGGFYIHAWEEDKIREYLTRVFAWLLKNAARNPTLVGCPPSCTTMPHP